MPSARRVSRFSWPPFDRRAHEPHHSTEGCQVKRFSAPADGESANVAQASYRRSGRGGARRRSLGFDDVARHMRDEFVKHSLLTYAAAMAFQMFVALLPLAFLGLALLGVFGL